MTFQTEAGHLKRVSIKDDRQRRNEVRRVSPIASLVVGPGRGQADVSMKVIEAGMETGCCKRLQDANYQKWPDTAVRSTASLIALEDAESVHEERLNNKAVSIVFIYYFILIDLLL